MLHQGAITVEQAEGLLDALERSYKAEASAAKPAAEAAAPVQSGPNWGELGTALAQRIQQGLSGAFPGIGSMGGRTNFGDLSITKAYLERMEDGSSLTNFGDLTISDDVPAELLERKVGSMTNFGDVSGPAALVEIMQARCHTNFGDFSASDGGKAKLSNLGETVLTREQLLNIGDGSSYSNLGTLTVASDVPPELLAQKIARYENLGKTYGPAALIGVLQARCPENLGKFVPSGGTDDDGEDE
jgi:hypothetical protein